MSEYVVCETEMTDLDVLKEALIDLGVPAGHVEVHDVPVALTGYQGDQRQQRANVIIPRRHVGGSSNDIGFEKVDGKYTVIVSEYDRARGLGKTIHGGIAQAYAKQQVVAMAKRKAGCSITSMATDKDGKVRIRMRLR